MKKADIIIETPKGSQQKYAWDKSAGHFRLKKVLPSGMMFPFDFGFIDGTRGEHGDPLDALVISEFKSFPGCLMKCRLVGAALAEQSGKDGTTRNDRYFFIPLLSKQFQHCKKLSDLPDEIIAETEAFFIQYNKLEEKKFRIINTVGPDKAFKLIIERG